MRQNFDSDSGSDSSSETPKNRKIADVPGYMLNTMYQDYKDRFLTPCARLAKRDL